MAITYFGIMRSLAETCLPDLGELKSLGLLKELYYYHSYSNLLRSLTVKVHSGVTSVVPKSKGYQGLKPLL